MSKITFVYPDFEHLGVEYLMAVCLREGHEVNFIYYQAEDTIINRKIKNIPFQKIAKQIADTHPDLVAFSCVTDNYQNQLQCARALKEIVPDVLTIFGGVHPTAVPNRVLCNVEVDCVAIGEAEKCFSDFLKECSKGDTFTLPESPIDGMVFKKNGKLLGEFREGPLADLNTLSFPYKKPFLNLLKDLSHEYRIITSRGCPYKCSYCFNSQLHQLRGKTIVRQRSVDNVIKELALAKDLSSLKYISFQDDCFTTNEKWILEFCDRYKKEINIPFGCQANPFYLNKKRIEALKSAGCIYIQIGVQSISEELCSTILMRRSNNAKTAEAITDIKEAGIMVECDHMFGVPDDTQKQHEEAALFYNKYRPGLIGTVWLIYYPKTAIVDIAKQRGLITDEDINKIEEGIRPNAASYISCGDVKNPERYYSNAILLNYLPILPRWLVSFLLYTRLYRILRIKNFFFAIAVPRSISAIINRKDFRARSHLIRFFDVIFWQKLKRTTL